MLEFAILGLLQQSPMHGYELRKQLAQLLGGLRSISYGSLYPALRRMQAAGLVSTDEPGRHEDGTLRFPVPPHALRSVRVRPMPTQNRPSASWWTSSSSAWAVPSRWRHTLSGRQVSSIVV